MSIKEEYIVAGIVGVILLAVIGMVMRENFQKKGSSPVIHGSQDAGEEMIAGFKISEIFPSP